eukprot:TRINITY_DN6596_c0_g1_i2.p1 TRINITY_DN6596_c0_g1~~TRINITY_DN6596_c0_g1_i2.p1  ORF type:complete len:459 (-),score=69.55 TRINITY_DN6596_c0_g1_i2:252-1628(-)
MPSTPQRSTSPLRSRQKRRRSRVHQVQAASISTEPQRQPLADAPSGRRSIYRRPLPSTVVAFNSEDGRKLFGQALTQGGLEGSYWSLSENFNTQMEPASCGPGTLAMVLNSLAIDPQREWKGVWRWFTEDVLVKCCFDHTKFMTNGTTLHELAGCARCNGADVKMRLSSDEGESIGNFRDNLKKCTMDSNTGERMVVSFDRGALSQTGTGHFSSIGAYHPEEDMVLVMEVARFKYFPFWCPVSVMWDAMKSVDPETNTSRGYMMISRGESAQGHCHLDHEGQPGAHVCGEPETHGTPQICWRQATDKLVHVLGEKPWPAGLELTQSPWLLLTHRLNDVFDGGRIELNQLVRPKVEAVDVQQMMHPFKHSLLQTSTHSFVTKALAEPDDNTVDLATILMLGFAMSVQKSGSPLRTSSFGPALMSVSTCDLEEIGAPLRQEVTKISDMLLLHDPKGRLIN